MKHLWQITGGCWKPTFASTEKHGDVIITELDNDKLSDAIIHDHQARSAGGRPDSDYRVEDYDDEIAIFVRSGTRSRKLVNLQYEGQQP